jgi:hypothetical protein
VGQQEGDLAPMLKSPCPLNPPLLRFSLLPMQAQLQQSGVTFVPYTIDICSGQFNLCNSGDLQTFSNLADQALAQR